MATTTLTLTRASWAVIGMTDSELDFNQRTGTTFTSPFGAQKALLIRYTSPSSGYLRRRIVSVQLTPSVTWLTDKDGRVDFDYGALAEAFTPSTVTRRSYGGIPAELGWRKYDQTATPGFVNAIDVDVRAATGNGILLAPKPPLPAEEFVNYSSVGTNPSLKIVVDSENARIRFLNEETPDEINCATDSVFAVTLGADRSITPLTVLQCMLYYQQQGADLSAVLAHEDENGRWTAVLPGEFLTAGPIAFYWSVIDSFGATTTSEATTATVVNRPFLRTYPADNARLDRTKPTTFSYDGLWPEDVQLHYAVDVEPLVFSSRPVTGSSVTLPANTFGSNNYVYYFSGYSAKGQAERVETTPQKFTTIDTLSTATADSPLGVVVADAQGIVFRWTHVQESGSPQTAAELQKSADGTTWTSLASVTGAAASTVVASGTLTSGSWFWRVRTRNIDNVWGAWSDAAAINVMTASTVPVVSVPSPSPRPVVQWQASEQEAVEILLDGELYREFGTGKSWTPPKYLDDGTHTVAVRAVNNLGLWSTWGERPFTVANTPGEEISLNVQSDYRADLTWQGYDYDFYLVYRDGVPIGRTTGTGWTDHLSVGPVTYQVRGCYADSDNYGLSAEAAVDIRPRWPVLIDVESGIKIDLDVSEDQIREVEHGAGMSFASYKVAGRTFPVKVGTGFGESTTELKAAFASLEELRSFDMFLHRLVCLKTSARSVIGILETVRAVNNGFYYVVDFKISACDYPQEIDIDTGVRYG